VTGLKIMIALSQGSAKNILDSAQILAKNTTKINPGGTSKNQFS